MTFEEHVISTTAIEARSVFATDVDGDGDTDVLSASWEDDKIAWYESDGGSPPAFTEWVISTVADGANSVFALDVDGDGDTDVISTLSVDDSIAWYESDGSPPVFTERIISTMVNLAQSVFAADVDGDGATDLLSASWADDTVAWWESSGGSPPVFTERIISTEADGASSIFATDLDGDGATDVLTASGNDDTIAWYRNRGGSPPLLSERIISTTAHRAWSVFATDIDGDGTTDVLSASSDDDKIAWYESDGGSPPEFTERIISTVAIVARGVFATDVDMDGDTDVLSASQDDDKIAWYESDGGSPPAFTERVISTVADGASSVFATDLDGDGDTDVLSASRFDDKIAWYEQLGSPGGLGASVAGMTLDRVSCENLTTAQSGVAGASGATSWTCDGLGVSSSTGDRVTLWGVGTADGTAAVGGSVSGLTSPLLRRVICQNLTTAQTVQFKAAADSWDCEAEGLIAAAGDRIRQLVRGEV